MSASRLLVCLMLLPIATLPMEAQRIAPVAARGTDASMMSAVPERVSPLVARRDTEPEPRREIRPVGTLLGGTLGGVVGTFVGMYAGAMSAQGCHGEECGLMSALLGAAVGESIGVGLGAHVGSGSRHHENIVLTSLTSAGILVGGLAAGVGLGQMGVGEIMIPVIPALQLAAALAIESH